MNGIEARKVTQILPEHLILSKGITWIEGPGYFGKEMRFLAQETTAVLLSENKTVHWIDGAHRFNPSTFFEPLRKRNCSLEEGLRRLYIGRGFTLHQLHALILRVHQETVLTKASLVVVDGLLAMFLDEQIRRYEGRAILRHCLHSLEKLSEQCPVILIDGHASSRLHQQLKCTVKAHSSRHLLGYWKTSRKEILILRNTLDSETLLQLLPKQIDESQSRLEAFTSTGRVAQHQFLLVDSPSTQTE
jgi:hypothetical protein